MSNTARDIAGGEEGIAEEERSKEYAAGCHCGNIRLSVTLSPPLETHKVLNCNCSICRRAGYLLVYPLYDAVKWHDGSKERCAKYEFNTKTKDHLFCPKCGASICIDFYSKVPKRYGISVRSFDGVDLDKLQLKKLDGLNEISPAKDLSGR